MENGRPQGKWLLYLTEQPLLRNGNGFCTLPAGQMPNPLNLTSKSEPHHGSGQRRAAKSAAAAPLENLLQSEGSSQLSDVFIADKLYADLSKSPGTTDGAGSDSFLKRRRRRRREVEQIVAPIRVHKHSPDGAAAAEEELVVRLDCELGTAKCLTVTCQVYNLPAKHSVTLEIRSRLWNATLVEDYFDAAVGDGVGAVDRVEIFSKAQVIVDSVYTQDVTNDFEAVMTTALPDRQLEPTRGLDWWIYVVSVACGLLVLIIIVLILWRLGFFERRRRPGTEDDSDFMMSANFEKVKLNGNSDY